MSDFIRVIVPDGDPDFLLRAERSDRYKTRVAVGGLAVDLYFSQDFLLQARDLEKLGGLVVAAGFDLSPDAPNPPTAYGFDHEPEPAT